MPSVSAPSHGSPAPSRRSWWPRAALARAGFGALLPLALLALWQTAAWLEWVPPQILPPPLAVAATLADLAQSGELWMHTAVSLQRVFVGFALGLSTGLVLGTAMGLSTTAREFLYPSFRAIAQVPSLGWLPLLMLLVGIDEALKLILIAKAVAVPVAMSTVQGIRQVPAALFDVARVLRFSRAQLVWRLVLPAAFGPIWGGVRYGFTHAWLALVAVELLASSEGLGFLIVYGRQLYQLDVVLASVAVVGLVGLVLDQVLAIVETRVLRWRVQGLQESTP